MTALNTAPFGLTAAICIEPWRDNAVYGEHGKISSVTHFYEPDFNKYAEMPEVEAVAKVYSARVSLRAGSGKLDNVQLMAVDTDAFGEAAYYRSDLFPAHFYNYLNTPFLRAAPAPEKPRLSIY